MNIKEVREIKRHLRNGRANITHVFGCYVRDSKEIISEFSASMGTMPENESEKYLNILKKTLSGTLGKNLIDIAFSTKQVANPAPEHALLMALRKSSLKDEDARKQLYKKIIDSVVMESDYLILMGCDSYDVPFKSKDDQVQRDADGESFIYIVCAICPVKATKANLHYVQAEEPFHDGGILQAVSNPEVGFMFPSFDNRSTNIYNALLYTRNTGKGHEALVEAVFNVNTPRPAEEQKALFGAVLSSTLGEECDIQVVQELHNHIAAAVQLSQEATAVEPVTVTKEELESVLRSCAVPEEKLAKFGEVYEAEFGAGAVLNAQNILDMKHFEIRTEDVIVKVDPTKRDLVEMRTIGGVEYILIPADNGVEVNGIRLGTGALE